MLVVPIVKSPRNTRKPRGTGSHPGGTASLSAPFTVTVKLHCSFCPSTFLFPPLPCSWDVKRVQVFIQKEVNISLLWVFLFSSLSLSCLSSFPPPTLLAFRISQPALSYIALESLFPSLVQRELWTILKPKLGVIRVFNYQIQCVRQGMEFDSF